MTLLDFEELMAYWVEYPPSHILMASYLGLGNGKRTRMPPEPRGAVLSRVGNKADSDVTPLLAELGPGFGSGDVHAGLAPVVLDFAELRRRATAGN